MQWKDVIGQERVVDALQRVIEQDRVPHASLFQGPDGVGKRAVALAFAAALQCEGGQGRACGTCAACTKVARLTHPDVHFLLPYPTDVDPDGVAERLALLATNPYAAVDFLRRPSLADRTKESNKQAIYTIQRINEDLRREIGFRPVEGRYKVVIMTDAHLLRVEAANALLKLIEEPPPQTVFMLTTDRVERLLPTILSRCRRFRFDPLAPEAIEQALVEREGTDPALAPTIARMADGSYMRALDLAGSEELLNGRAFIIEFLRAAYIFNINKVADIVETLSSSGRERLKGTLDLMLRWIRDLMLYRHMGEAAPIVNIDQRDTVASFCRNIPDANLEAMMALTEDAARLIERNVNTTLIFLAFTRAMNRAMHGSSTASLYNPLAEEAVST